MLALLMPERLEVNGHSIDRAELAAIRPGVVWPDPWRARFDSETGEQWASDGKTQCPIPQVVRVFWRTLQDDPDLVADLHAYRQSVTDEDPAPSTVPLAERIKRALVTKGLLTNEEIDAEA